MPTRIRLARHGRRGHAYYHIIVADSRAPRDGKFIEKLGTYNPNTNPATIDFDFERALYWLQVGAQPSDTTRAILSQKGVLLKHHLLNGVKKGALTAEQVEQKFNAWVAQKDVKVQSAVTKLTDAKKAEEKKRLENERKISLAKAEAAAKKRAEKETSVNTENTEDANA